MRVSLERAALLSAVEAVAWVRSGKAIRPYDGQMLIETKGAAVVDVTLREDPYHAQAPIDAAVDEAGAVVVPFDVLRGWLDACSGSAIELRTTGSEVVLRGQLGWTKLRGPDERDFPRRPYVHSRGASLAMSSVRDVLKSVLFAMAGDPHPLAYAELQFHPSGLIEARAASASCRAIASERMEGDRTGGRQEWLVPARLAKTLASERFTDESEVLIASSNNGVWLSAGRAEVSGPALERVTWDAPTNRSKVRSTVDRLQLISAVKMLRSVCANADFAGIRLEAARGKLTMALEGAAHAEARNSLEAPMTGEGPASVIVAIGALHDAALHARGTHIAVAFGEETDPLELCGQADAFQTTAYVTPRVPDVV